MKSIKRMRERRARRRMSDITGYGASHSFSGDELSVLSSDTGSATGNSRSDSQGTQDSGWSHHNDDETTPRASNCVDPWLDTKLRRSKDAEEVVLKLKHDLEDQLVNLARDRKRYFAKTELAYTCMNDLLDLQTKETGRLQSKLLRLQSEMSDNLDGDTTGMEGKYNLLEKTLFDVRKEFEQRAKTLEHEESEIQNHSTALKRELEKKFGIEADDDLDDDGKYSSSNLTGVTPELNRLQKLMSDFEESLEIAMRVEKEKQMLEAAKLAEQQRLMVLESKSTCLTSLKELAELQLKETSLLESDLLTLQEATQETAENDESNDLDRIIASVRVIEKDLTDLNSQYDRERAQTDKEKVRKVDFVEIMDRNYRGVAETNDENDVRDPLAMVGVSGRLGIDAVGTTINAAPERPSHEQSLVWDDEHLRHHIVKLRTLRDAATTIDEEVHAIFQRHASKSNSAAICGIVCDDFENSDLQPKLFTTMVLISLVTSATIPILVLILPQDTTSLSTPLSRFAGSLLLGQTFVSVVLALPALDVYSARKTLPLAWHCARLAAFLCAWSGGVMLAVQYSVVSSPSPVVAIFSSLSVVFGLVSLFFSVAWRNKRKDEEDEDYSNSSTNEVQRGDSLREPLLGPLTRQNGETWRNGSDYRLSPKAGPPPARGPLAKKGSLIMKLSFSDVEAGRNGG